MSQPMRIKTSAEEAGEEKAPAAEGNVCVFHVPYSNDINAAASSACR